MTQRKRIQLSFLVAKTHRLLLLYLIFLGIILSTLYLFGMNRVAMKGYVLTKVIEKNRELSSQLGQLDAQIAKFQTREYVDKKSEASFMVQHNKRQFVVLKETFTAQK